MGRGKQLKWLPNTPQWHKDLLQASADGDLERLQCLWDQASNNDDVRREESKTPWRWEEIVCATGGTCWHWACGGGHHSVAEWLFNEQSIDVNLRIASNYCGRDRTALHYACRNGQLHIVQWLVETCGADSNPLTIKDGVSPIQLAIWQNWFPVVAYLAETVGVDLSQVNNYGCGAVHWLGVVPLERAGRRLTNSNDEESGHDLLPMADLFRKHGLDFAQKQNGLHTALHKASWGGHLALVRYLHKNLQMHDIERDIGGNYAADVADMQASPRHRACADYLRRYCSPQRLESLRRLGLDPYREEPYDMDTIRKAYLERARLCHPDAKARFANDDDNATGFDSLRKAYDHLTSEGGMGNQRNPAHSINLMLTMVGSQKEEFENELGARNQSSSDQVDKGVTMTSAQDADSNPQDLFKARLLAVLMEYDDKGIDLSNLISKWKQVWPGIPFPSTAGEATTRKQNRLSLFLKTNARDVVRIVKVKGGPTKVLPRNLQRHDVLEHHSKQC